MCSVLVWLAVLPWWPVCKYQLAGMFAVECIDLEARPAQNTYCDSQQDWSPTSFSSISHMTLFHSLQLSHMHPREVKLGQKAGRRIGACSMVVKASSS